MTLPKKMIVRDMTVNEISTVDVPAQPGAVAVILKSGAVDIRKNASEVAAGEAAPLYKAAEYGDAIMARAEEIALAILAEALAFLRGRSGGSLRAASGRLHG